MGDRPRVLTAIEPDSKAIITQTFEANDTNGVRKFIGGYNGGTEPRNIYWNVNTTLRPLSKKVRREDIASLAYLHVDIDPRAGEDIDEERDRALRMLQSPPRRHPRADDDRVQRWRLPGLLGSC